MFKNPFKNIDFRTDNDWRSSDGQYFVIFSDIHVNGRENSQHARAKDLIRNLRYDWSQNLSHYFSRDDFSGILLVGDLTNAGVEQEYNLLEDLFLAPIREIFKAKQANTYAVPGNHDLIRTILSKNYFWHSHLHPRRIKKYYKRISFASNEKNKWNKANQKRFEWYDSWLKNNTTTYNSDSIVAGPWSTVCQGKHLNIRIGGINSAIASTGYVKPAWLNILQESRPDHWISAEQVYKSLGSCNEGLPTIAMMHHSPSDLDFAERNSLEAIKELADILIHGHHHLLEAEDKTETLPIRICAPSFGNPGVFNKPESRVNERDSYAILRIDATKVQVFYRTYRPPTNESVGGFEGDNGKRVEPSYSFDIGEKVEAL